MLDMLKNTPPFDILWFQPGPQPDSTMVSCADYKDPGEKLDKSELGDSYHIVLFKLNEMYENNKKMHFVKDFDTFDAVLSGPLEYLSGLIKNGWFGILAKKTTTSKVLIQHYIDNLT